MTNLDIARQRLNNQLISRQPFEKPEDVVQWLGAVQSQDYAAAKWALGLRLPASTDDAIEQAFAEGAILRTHVLHYLCACKSVLHNLYEMKAKNRRFFAFISYKLCKTDLCSMKNLR